jgi:hypothetical protein
MFIDQYYYKKTLIMRHKILLSLLLIFTIACTNAQNVGIGTSSPTDMLSVSGASPYQIGAYSSSTIGTRVGLNNSSTGGISWQLISTGSGNGEGTGNFLINDLTGARVTILSASGNVGIGTVTPGQKLEVAGTTKTTNFQMTNGASNGYIFKSDASGNASWVNPNTITTATTNTLALSTNTLTSTVNGVAATSSAVSGVSNTWTQSAGLTTTVNGVTGNINPASGTVANVLGYNSTGTPVYQAMSATTHSVSNTVNLAGNTISTTIDGTTGTAVTPPNIYSTDGTLAASRTVTMAANNLTFGSTTGNLFFNPSSTGRVGIGSTNTPYQTLTITNPTGVYSNSESMSNGLSVETGQTTGDYILYMSADKTNALSYIQSVHYGTAVANLALNARGGNVGIGNISPTVLLEVGSGGATGKAVVYSQDASYGEFQIANPASNGEASMAFISGATAIGGSPASVGGTSYVWDIGAGNYGIGGNKFGIGNQAYGGTILNVTSAGSVGIGTSGPGSKLDVRGTTFGLTDYGIVTIGDNSAQPNGLGIGYDATNNWSWLYSRTSGCCARPIDINGTIYVNAFNAGVGIGTSAPSNILHVGAENGQGIDIGNPNDQLSVAGGGSYSIRFYGYRDVVNYGIAAKIAAQRTYACCSGAGTLPWLEQGTDLVFSTTPGMVVGSGSSGAPADNSYERMRVTGGGNVGIGTSAPDNLLSVNGSADKPGGGSWATFSDRRIKKDVTDYSEGLSLIMKVHPVNYRYSQDYIRLFGHNKEIENGKIYQGVIAQELQKIAPDMVTRSTVLLDSSDAGSNLLHVDPSKFIYTTINAIQEQQGQIEELKKENEVLKKDNESLKSAKADASDVKELKLQIEELKRLVEMNAIRSEK